MTARAGEGRAMAVLKILGEGPVTVKINAQGLEGGTVTFNQ